MAIMRNTISSIQQRQETRMEIETTLAGKMMEQNMMSAIPMLILGYVSLTSPEFLEVMYTSPAGKIVSGGLPCNLRGQPACGAGEIMTIEV